MIRHDFIFSALYVGTMTARYPINKDPVKPVSSKDAAPTPKEIPDIIVDPNSKRKYERGRFLGKVRNIYFSDSLWGRTVHRETILLGFF